VRAEFKMVEMGGINQRASWVAKDLLKVSSAELDDLFRRSPAGPIPSGPMDGTVLFDPGHRLAEVAARVAHLVVWKGKVFDPVKGELRNQVSPTGIPAIVAKVYLAPSWLDGKECIVLDYSETSLVAHWIRDEIRLLAPGLYLGLVFWDKERILRFALSSPSMAAATA
jgi:hypothetical protein